MIEDKPVIESYKDVWGDNKYPIVPSLKDVKNKVIHNISSRCYYLIYDMTAASAQESTIAKTLDKHSYEYTDTSGQVQNRAQQLVFREVDDRDN